MTKNILRYLLIAIIVIIAISGISGGVSLMVDPSGANIQLNTSLLESTIFHNFLVPGIILFLLLGIFPFIAAFGLMTRKKSKLLNRFNPYKKKHWAWAYSLYCGIILVLWIDFQVMMIGGGYILQSIYAILGVIVIILTLLPSTIRFYKIKK